MFSMQFDLPLISSLLQTLFGFIFDSFIPCPILLYFSLITLYQSEMESS